MLETTTSTNASSGDPSAQPSGKTDAAAIADILGTPATEAQATPAARGVKIPWKLLLVFVLAGGGAVAYPYVKPYIGSDEEATALDAMPSVSVAQSDLVISVTEEGSLVSAENVDIACGVAGGATIVSLVDDGAQVTEGMELGPHRISGSRSSERAPTTFSMT